MPDGVAGVVYDVLDRSCPARGVLDDVCNRWSLLALVALGDGTLRFTELRRRVDGVSEKMLAQALRGLERDGFVERTAYAVIPPRVDYRLTPSGEQLLASTRELVTWLEQHTDEVLASQRRYDRRTRRRGASRETAPSARQVGSGEASPDARRGVRSSGTPSARQARQIEGISADGHVNEMSAKGTETNAD